MKPKNILLLFLLGLISFLMCVSNVFADVLNLPPSITVNIYETPGSVIALDKTYLTYEMYLTNYMPTPITLTALDTTDGNKHFNLTDGLDKSIQTINPNDKNNRFLFQPGESKVIYMMYTFDHLSNVPSKLIHHFNFTSDSDGKTYQLSYTQLAVNKKSPVIVNAPLRGTNWVTGNGFSNSSIHRRAGIYFDGKPYYSERYAIDFVQIDTASKTYKGDRDKNASYYCYNQDILAVANGKVAATKDGIPENIPNSGKYAAPIDLETMDGNYIIIDLGNGKFAAYAHLIPGSLKVKLGDSVRSGQVIAKLGNSGHSSEPHLHFQLVDKPSMLTANGIPYGFDHFNLIPTEVDGNTLKFLNTPPVKHINQLPLEDIVMDFGG